MIKFNVPISASGLFDTEVFGSTLSNVGVQ